MHIHRLATSFASFGFLVTALVACSGAASSDIAPSGSGGGGGGGGSGGGGTFSCPKAGDKICPNGKVIDDEDEFLCNKCFATSQASAACEGPPTCSAAGNDTVSVKPECTAQFNALLDCYFKAQVKDAGVITD